MSSYWREAQGQWHKVVGSAPSLSDPWGYPDVNATIVAAPGSTSATSTAPPPSMPGSDYKPGMSTGDTGSGWTYNPSNNQWSMGKESPTYYSGPTTSSPSTPSAAPSDGQQMIKPGDLQIAQLDWDKLKFVAQEKRLADQFAQQLALSREQMASDAAGRQAALASAGADRASREAMHSQDLAQQMAIANMEKETRILSMSLDATLKTGYIPKTLADKLGIQAGPTLETQQLAWNRYVGMMQQAAAPGSVVDFLYTSYGLQPDPSKPIPFIDAIANGMEPPQQNIGGNMDAISKQAREFTAKNLAAQPNLIQNEAVNPAALAPIGGTGFLDNLNLDRSSTQSNPISYIQSLMNNRTRSPQFTFGG